MELPIRERISTKKAQVLGKPLQPQHIHTRHILLATVPLVPHDCGYVIDNAAKRRNMTRRKGSDSFPMGLVEALFDLSDCAQMLAN